MFAQLFKSNSVLFYQISRALFFCYRNSKSSIKYIQLPTVFFSTLGHEKSVEPPSFPFVPYAKRTQNIKWSSSVYHCKNQLSLGPPFCWWRLEVILRSNLFLFVLQASWQRRKKIFNSHSYASRSKCVNAHILCLQALPIHMQKWNIRKLNKDPPTKKRAKRATKSFSWKCGKR